MYYDHFGLQAPPFSISPDPRFLYLSERHRNALAHLIYGAGENGGFVLLTGQVGTGKTTLIRSLLSQDLSSVDIALCLHSGLSTIDFVASILDELDIRYPTNSHSLKPLVDILNEYLLKRYAEGRQTVLIIDEGQNLSREVLEQVRLLTNLETDSQKLLRIILVGQEELHDIINRPDLRQLSQRITGRYHLTALSISEVKEYVSHRIKTAQGNPSIFPSSVIRKIYKHTQGIPRLINVLCDRALLVAYNSDSYRVTKKHISIAAKEILPQQSSLTKQSFTSRPSFAWAMLPVGLLSLMGLTYGAHYYLNKFPLKNNHASIVETPQSYIERSALHTEQNIKNTNNLDADEDLQPSSDKISLVFAGNKDTKTKPNIEEATLSTEDISTIAIEGAKKDIIKTDEQLSLLEMIIANNAGYSQTDGIKKLLKSWNLAIDIPANEAACQYAESQNMTCLTAQVGGFPLIYEINRPALLELKLKGKTYWLPIIKSKDKNDIICFISNKNQVCSIAEIAPYWTGNMLMLLRKPEVSVNISPNFKGEQVKWLRQRVAIAENQSLDLISDSITYDKILVDKVKRFQKEHSLAVDGVIGDKTLLYLYNVVIDDNTPTLRGNNN